MMRKQHAPFGTSVCHGKLLREGARICAAMLPTVCELERLPVLHISPTATEAAPLICQVKVEGSVPRWQSERLLDARVHTPC